jgi:hypothetical protein
MYRKKETGQLLLSDFFLPFGGKLNSDNRWVKLSQIIPWDKIEDKYSENFKGIKGNIALSVRVALGSIIIKEKCGFTDEELVEQIQENAYLQYFLGYTEFINSKPFDPSLMVAFRKRISFIDINELMIEISTQPNDCDLYKDSDDNSDNDKPNSGKLIIDATCTPADIHYPTDLSLLNKCREKSEEIIDKLFSQVKEKYSVKPRTYRKNARRDYLRVEKQRKSSKKSIHNVIRKQLNYVGRDLRIIHDLIENGASLSKLSKRQYHDLLVLNEVYRQQLTMFCSCQNSTESRITSISQPHVRPVVRGKASAKVEFGAKISVSVISGFCYIEKLDWENFNEGIYLIESIERYRRQYGCYPEAVLADKIYRNRNNLSFCQEKGIRLSGPKLGRPSKNKIKIEKCILKQDEGERNLIESCFGVGKRRFGLGRIMAKLQCTSETVIALQFLIMNLEHKLKVLFANFAFVLFYYKILEFAEFS